MDAICLMLSLIEAAEVSIVRPAMPPSFCRRVLKMMASPIVIPTVPPSVLEDV